MSADGADPAERAQVLLLRAEELLGSGTAESAGEAMLALEGARDAAQADEVDQALRDRIDERLTEARRVNGEGGPSPA